MRHAIVAILMALGAISVASASFAKPLRVVGRNTVLEMGPILRAAETSPKGSVEIRNGGVPNLWGDPDTAMPVVVAPGTPGVLPPNQDLADLAGNSETQMLRMSLRHPDARYLMTVVDGLYRIVARRSRGIASEADLKGKRIGTFPSTSAAFYLHKVLERSNLTEADVTIVPLGPKDSADALIAGTVDAMSMWEPDAERAFRKLGTDAIAFQPPNLYREVYSLYATKASLEDPVKRAQIVAFVRQLIPACKEAATNPGHIQDLLVTAAFRPKDEIAVSWHHHNFPCAVSPDILDVYVDEEKWLAAIDGRAPRSREQLAPLIDASIVKEAMAPAHR